MKTSEIVDIVSNILILSKLADEMVRSGQAGLAERSTSLTNRVMVNYVVELLKLIRR